MNIKFHTSFACCSIILLMLSGTGYGITTLHDGAEVAGNVTDSRQSVSPAEKPRIRSEVLPKTASDNPDVLAPEYAGSTAEARANVSLENNSVTDGVKLDVEIETVVLESSPPRTASATTVSKWLEARANEDSAHEAHPNGHHEELEFLQDEGMEVVGGGWCNSCGCWMRHGCDTNGNCGISHTQVCGSGYCSLHPFSNCVNSG